MLNELIEINNLIQPGSGNPITLENPWDLESFEAGSTTISTIEQEEDCIALYCRIVGLNFSNYNITNIPESFENLIMLDSLNLSYNEINELPDSFSDIDNLRYLNLAHNNLSEITSNIGTQQNLYYLNISFNEINELPESFGQLGNLKYLNVSYNNLLNFNFTDFPFIENLFINGNSISELPNEFCDLNFVWSDLNYSVNNNHLCSNLPQCIYENNNLGSQECNETQVAILESIINQNNISESSSIHDIDNGDGDYNYIELGYHRWELGEIVELNLSMNPTTGMEYGYNISYFPTDLSDFTSLQALNLGNNSLAEIPSNIGLLTDLKELKYNDNFITGNLTSGGIPSSIEELQELEILNLSNNYITIPNPAIYGLINLKELYLDNNHIYYIDDDLGNLDLLEKLYVNNNEISSIPDEIRYLTGLTEFDGSNNQLFSMNENFRYLSQLQYLNLGNNFIQEIPSNINQNLNLRKLYFNNNQISVIPSPVFNLINLRELYLQNNTIYDLQGTFNAMNHLEVLHIQYNQLHQLPQSICNIDIDFSSSANELSFVLNLEQNYFCFNLPGCIEFHPESAQIIGEQDCYGSDLQVLSEILELNDIPGNPAGFCVWENDRLIELNMTNQEINLLPENLGYLAKLRNLNFSFNQIEDIPTSVQYLIELDSLYLNNNNLNSLPSGLSELDNLSKLDISHNSIINYPTVLDSIYSLNKLILNNNLITSISENLNDLSSLTYLDISNNEIGNLPGDLSNLNNLIELNISNNNLIEIPNTFSNFVSIESIKAQNNSIVNFPYIFEELINLKEINLSNNNLVEIDNNLFSGFNLEQVDLSNNYLLRMPESICDFPTASINVTDNYLYCSVGFENEEYIGEWNQNGIQYPSCIDEDLNLNLIGFESSNQGCENYGCAADGVQSDWEEIIGIQDSSGLALNFDDDNLMPCSETGLSADLNDCCLFANGPNLYVSPNGSDVNGDGSLNLPFKSIGLAVQYAANFDTVIVEMGQYQENVLIEDKDAVSILSRAVFEDDPVAKKYIINNTVINGGNDESCFKIENSGSTLLNIAGFTIEGGLSEFGGGLNFVDSDAKLSDLIIRKNLSSENGGGLFISGSSSIELESTIIDSNTAVVGSGYGGGIFIENASTLKLKNVDLSYNYSRSGAGLYIDNFRKTELENCIISNNEAINDGGGIYNRYDSLYFNNYIFSENGILDTINTKIIHNESRNGGGIFQIDSDKNIEGLIIEKNTASEKGGGIYIQSSTSEFINLILKENESNQGGAIYTLDSDIDFYHLTGFMNYANNGANLSSENSQISIFNSIFWEDANSTFDISDEDLIIQNSILSSQNLGETNFYVHPEFSEINQFGLTRVSPGLGQGIVNENIFTDIYGNLRVQSLNTNIFNPDIGAVEHNLGEKRFFNWYVSDVGNDNNSGIFEEASPLKSINLAIEKSLNGDIVFIADGDYEENIIFDGKNIKLMNIDYYDENNLPENCYQVSESISSNIQINSNTNNSVIKIIEGESKVEICGMTFTGGFANKGGGLFIENANPIIESVIFENNQSIDYGGGFYGNNFNGELRNIVFNNNKTSGDGGGIYLENSNPIIENIEVINNSGRVGNYNLDGGGIYLSNSEVTSFYNVKIDNNHSTKNGAGLYLKNSIIPQAVGLEVVNNNSNQNGGGIYLENSELNIGGPFITNISNNIAEENGGGIYALYGNINAENVKLNFNTSGSNAGAIYIDTGSNLFFNKTVIEENNATNDGGAIKLNGFNTLLDFNNGEIINNSSNLTSILYSNNGNVKLKNSLIEGNQSNSYPAGILAKNSNLSLFNITLTKNELDYHDVGGSVNIEQSSNVNIVNTIIWENGNDGSGVYLKPDGFHKTIYTTHSNIDNGRDGIENSVIDSVHFFAETNINTDPKFISPNKRYYYITKESPCVDSGTNLFQVGSDTILYIPEVKLIDGDGDGVSMADMGAYDKQVLSVYPGDLNNNGVVEISDLNSLFCYFQYEGIPRYSQGNSWINDGHGAIAWDDYINYPGSALTFADANGDGKINERDVLSVGLNWSNHHETEISGYEIPENDDGEPDCELNEGVYQTIYNGLSGNGEGFNEIRKYLERLLDINGTPMEFALHDNYPNPFNPNTIINFSLPRNSFVDLKIYDITGKLIKTIYDSKSFPIGHFSVTFDATELSSGIYFYEISTEYWNKTKKMTLIK